MWCRTIPQSRRTLAAGLLFFLAAQMLFNIVADMRHPELYDPEYGVRLALLRARQAEIPDRPLLLLIGSSRTVMSFRPEILGELRTGDGAQVLPFNFSHLAAGPLMNLMAYDRLRREGIRPRWLVMEVMAPNLSREPGTTPTTIANAGDLPLLDHHIHRPTLYGRYVMLRMLPWHRHRNDLVHRLAPALATPGTFIDEEDMRLGPLGGDIGWQITKDESPEFLERALAHARTGYAPRLQEFTIKESAIRAHCELVEMCRQDGVQVVLLLTPEGSEFRSWYPPEALQQIDAWCAAMRNAYGVPVVDARTWLPDSDFMDSHHVLNRGANTFTKRLEQELFIPLVTPTPEWSRPTPEGSKRLAGG